MKRFELDFSFKGARQYIQGPDIFDESVRLLREQAGDNLEFLEFVIHRMTDRNLYLTLYPAAQVPQLDAQDVAELKFTVSGQSWVARLTDTANQPASRRPYDETMVVEKCEIDEVERRIVFRRGETPYSMMETLVSMNKALHLKVFPDARGSWVFCQWNSPHWPLDESLNGVCIQLKQALGTRLTRAEVSLDDRVIGQMYFSARDKQ
jgi:hypothetical protein